MGMGDTHEQILKNLRMYIINHITINIVERHPFEGAFLSSPTNLLEDLGSPQIGELFYSDAMPE